MGASYDKINNLIFKTDVWKSFMGRCKRRADSIRIDKYISGCNWEGTPSLTAIVAAGYDDETSTSNFSNGSFWGVERVIASDKDYEDLVRSVFGVKNSRNKYVVPTFNCKINKVIENFREAGKKQAHDELGLSLDYGCKLDSIRTRFNQEFRAFEASDAGRQMLSDARDDYTVVEIKKVLLRFKDASTAVLKRAIDEYIVHCVSDD